LTWCTPQPRGHRECQANASHAQSTTISMKALPKNCSCHSCRQKIRAPMGEHPEAQAVVTGRMPLGEHLEAHAMVAGLSVAVGQRSEMSQKKRIWGIFRLWRSSPNFVETEDTPSISLILRLQGVTLKQCYCDFRSYWIELSHFSLHEQHRGICHRKRTGRRAP